MANEIRIKTSVEVIQDVGASAGAQNGITYTSKELDGNADYRSWGGRYSISTAYTDNDVCYWKNVVVSATGADGIGDSGWTEAGDVTDGTIPAAAHVVAVEYVRQAIGADSNITVQINSEVHALLAVGESIVIPLHAGEAPANIEVFDTNYGSGTREAVVNVMMAGV